ncbi:zinc ABC transporter substrate-binding protein [Desulfovibrio sp.]|uniref:metal ABC transporter solute-binding protein, Zn/Mn family n=1 Tax=Desulfovibrio sp. TaxID=885 RepID=UPI0025C0C55C|nr:zinc ABC transporter substrate-binding protein [Desulfovibrio sp.]
MHTSFFVLFRHGAVALLVAAVMICASVAPQAAPARAQEQGQGSLRVLATTYPVYLLARNVAQAQPHVQVDLLIPAQTGCPHDYALSPGDMKKLAGADVLLLNGLGMDDFLQKALPAGKPGLVVVDSSEGVIPLRSAGAGSEHADHDHAHDGSGHGGHSHAGHAAHSHGPEEHGHDHVHEHHHGGLNPHVFTSPRQASIMVNNMARGLAKADPQNAAAYEAAARSYEKILLNLGRRLAALGGKAPNKGIVLMHDALAYMARDGGLEVIAVIQENEDAQPSAARLVQIAKTIHEHRPALIISEPQYTDKPVQALARETGIPAVSLDSLASGPASPSLDYYEKTMSNNLDTLEKHLEQR